MRSRETFSPFHVAWERGQYITHSLVPRPFPPPVFHRFQYEIRQGKAWEIWSRAMPSSRHKVDTRRAVPNEESQCPVLYCPSNGWISERSQGRRSIPFIVHNADNAGDGSTRNRYFNGWAPPLVCLPSVYLTSSHVTRSPRPSPAVFHTERDEMLAVGMAWERGYITHSLVY